MHDWMEVSFKLSTAFYVISTWRSGRAAESPASDATSKLLYPHSIPISICFLFDSAKWPKNDPMILVTIWFIMSLCPYKVSWR